MVPIDGRTAPRPFAKAIFPGGGGVLGAGKWFARRVDHRGDQFRLTREVAVEGHGGEADCSRDALHRNGFKAFLVGDADGSRRDFGRVVAGFWSALWRRFGTPGTRDSPLIRHGLHFTGVDDEAGR